MRRNRPLTRLWQANRVRRVRHAASPRLWYRQFTASLRGLPDFVIAGAQKAGTTSLFGYLSGHPQCGASYSKEVHYFDQHFARGENWYRMHFPLAIEARGGSGGRSRRRCFESSPYYMFDPRVPARMAKTLPGAKIIFLLRNPASRAYSHYQHSVRRGREPLSFEAALDAEAVRLAGEQERLLAQAQYQSPAHRNFSYLARGVYADQLVGWQARFAKEQLLVIQAERMFSSPKEVFGHVLDFLGLQAWRPADFGNRNSGHYRTAMSPDVRDRLTRYFAPHNERLFNLIGARFDWR